MECPVLSWGASVSLMFHLRDICWVVHMFWPSIGSLMAWAWLLRPLICTDSTVLNDSFTAIINGYIITACLALGRFWRHTGHQWCVCYFRCMSSIKTSQASCRCCFTITGSEAMLIIDICNFQVRMIYFSYNRVRKVMGIHYR